MNTDWFAQARSVFGRRETPVSQPFSVPCDCGAVLYGERAESLQKPTCPQCGQTAFVLPATPYPVPGSLRRRWAGEEPAVAEPASKKRKSSRNATTAVARPPGVPWSQRRQHFSAWLRGQLTPVRLVALAVCLLIGALSLVLYRQARWSHAQATVQPAIDAGHEALAERDFAAAAKAFTQATAALDVLGRRDDASHTLRRLSREVTVCDQLSSDSLETLLDELHNKTDDADVATRFDKQCAGRWFLFDAPAYLATDGNGKAARSVRFDLPLVVRDKPLELLLDGSPWPALLSGSTASAPKRVLFAAQLDRFEPATKTRPVARVWLRGNTAVLWSESETLAALDFLPGDAEQQAVIDSLLAAQRALQETQP
jgi:hypothetical protein